MCVSGEGGLTLDKAVSLLGGSGYRRVFEGSCAHHLFYPYRLLDSSQLHYFRLLEVPLHLQISEEIYEWTARRFKGFLHQVEIIHLQKTFQKNQFLLKATTNVMTFQELARLKAECREHIQNEQMLTLLETMLKFVAAHPEASASLRPECWGSTLNSGIVCCDYTLYFRSPSAATAPEVALQIETTLASLLGPAVPNSDSGEEDSQDPSVDSFQEHPLNPLLTSFCSDLGRDQPPYADCLAQLERLKDLPEKDKATSATNSFASAQPEELNTPLLSDTTSLKASFARRARETLSKHSMLLTVLIGVVLLAALGLASYFVVTRPASCGEGEFLSASNRCAECASGCLRCDDGAVNSCRSCRSDMYLVLDGEDSTTGECKNECEGIHLNHNSCVRKKTQATLHTD